MIELAKEIASKKGMDFVYYVLEGLDTFNCDLEHEIETALDNDDVKWELLKEYCLPENADYELAKELALKDLKLCIQQCEKVKQCVIECCGEDVDIYTIVKGVLK